MRSRAVRLAGIWSAICALFAATPGAGCGKSPPLAAPAAPLTPPMVLCAEETPSKPCNDAEEVEAWLRDPRMVILGSAPTPGGRQDAKLLTVAVPREGGQRVLRAKWRALASETLVNDPRKELGAYAVSKLFLRPHEYVAPPTTGHCFALDTYRATVDAKASPSFPEQGVRCVFGILSYWLEDVTKPEDAHEQGLLSDENILDEKLFEKHPAYRKSVADLNLLTYLIRHGDAHDEQFLIRKDKSSPRVYSVDNSIAFQSIKNPMLIFRADWSTIQVPAISRASVERLMGVSAESWARLAVIEQYEQRGGLLIPTRTSGLVGQPGSGMRWIGLGLQIGLTDGEIAGLTDRVTVLVTDIEDGDVHVF